MAGKCSYQNCLKCEILSCMTGQIAREQGEAGYNEYLKVLDEAEELLEVETENNESTEHDEADVMYQQLKEYYDAVIPKELKL